MGIYLNPNNENFRMTLATGEYVDKTGMLSVTNKFIDKANNYVCVSRPRRFGKTIAGNMMVAYYSKGCDSRELFDDLEISSSYDYLEKLNKYNVIQIDMNSEYQNTEDKEKLIKILSAKINRELKNEFSQSGIDDDESLGNAILKVYSTTGEKFIIIMDEYDVLVREQVSERLFNTYLGFLNGLFKSNTLRPAIALAYLTGILPIVRDKVQSKLNNFKEYTFLDSKEFTEYVGFTEKEVRALCDKHKMDFDECRNWYDGYHQNGYEIYNPESVVCCMHDRKFEGYWGKTSSYQVISDRIAQNFAGTKEAVISMLAGEDVDVNVTRYMNTMDSFHSRNDIFTYLIHLGYLSYDYNEKTCRIPNGEVRQEWLNAIETADGYSTTNQIISASKQLLDDTLRGDEEAVAKALDLSHIHVTSNRSYNNEDSLQSAIYLAYIYALNKYTVVKEMTTGKGFADVVYIPYVPDIPALIIELKKNKTVESAIEQIKQKQYFDSLSMYYGNILFVGINYDDNTKIHTCKIEEYYK
ncbi:PD-(D/E)XK nuclease superfamily protein [Butyrivibrio proteoclasticus]|uniref:PD-(D/E)XK nuclease superfamily protein n=1 Tax=Butyrivibrio proteoclasticus TaxID=43305 RepID=A0A1I5VUN7_9FIRM|nr:AAA family ATPase [Butyrivibrio proteoclasticus]SFQ11151.1 PD-(D/E)XK nuclease superfamily protein [Butyrivibrio proteoclasticus]